MKKIPSQFRFLKRVIPIILFLGTLFQTYGMKNLALIFLSVLLFSCNKESPKSEKIQENYSVSGTGTLEVLLATAIPIEGGFSILEQAEHFNTSEIQYRNEGVFYVYVPRQGFTGIDVVKIKRSDSNGATIYAETISIYKINVHE